MGNGIATSAEAITVDDFNKLLKYYPDLIKSISSSKPGQKSLVELDEFRYVQAIKDLGGETSRRMMNYDDVKLLVEWKLRHGKFRPTLMSLVTSNSADVVTEVIQEAMRVHRAGDAPAALKTLCKLRGVGPATASLLLSVHDPENVLFFSDEAYYWLCGDGQKVSLKYNPKEYDQLKSEAKKMQERLEVSATAIEKVAYVIMKMSREELTSLLSGSQPAEAIAESEGPKQSQSEAKAAAKSEGAKARKQNATKSGAKRKADKPTTPVGEVEVSTRRSKRLRSQSDT